MSVSPNYYKRIPSDFIDADVTLACRKEKSEELLVSCDTIKRSINP